MRVLICGSRHFDDDDHFFEVLNEVNDTFNLHNKITCIIQGEAKGTDALAKYFAKVNEITLASYPADWKTHGKSAGPIRNQQMLDEGKPDLVIAFLAPDSVGTKDMINRAKQAVLPVKIINIK